jgi:hypothetical protein
MGIIQPKASQSLPGPSAKAAWWPKQSTHGHRARDRRGGVATGAGNDDEVERGGGGEYHRGETFPPGKDRAAGAYRSDVAPVKRLGR